jgi:hypothetical protein
MLATMYTQGIPSDVITAGAKYKGTGAPWNWYCGNYIRAVLVIPRFCIFSSGNL